MRDLWISSLDGFRIQEYRNLRGYLARVKNIINEEDGNWNWAIIMTFFDPIEAEETMKIPIREGIRVD